MADIMRKFADMLGADVIVRDLDALIATAKLEDMMADFDDA